MFAVLTSRAARVAWWALPTLSNLDRWLHLRLGVLRNGNVRYSWLKRPSYASEYDDSRRIVVDLPFDAYGHDLLPGEGKGPRSLVPSPASTRNSTVGRIARLAHKTEILDIRRQIVDFSRPIDFGN